MEHSTVSFVELDIADELPCMLWYCTIKDAGRSNTIAAMWFPKLFVDCLFLDRESI